VVVLGAHERVIYATRNGELANARTMSEQGIFDFLSQQVATASAP
jgi:hypothetical protein